MRGESGAEKREQRNCTLAVSLLLFPLRLRGFAGSRGRIKTAAAALQSEETVRGLKDEWEWRERG